MKKIKISLTFELIAIITASFLGITVLLSALYIVEMRNMSRNETENFIKEEIAHRRHNIYSRLGEAAKLLDYTAIGALPLIRYAADSEEDRMALQDYFTLMADTLPAAQSIFGSNFGLWTGPGGFIASGDGWFPAPGFDNTARGWFITGRNSGVQVEITDPYIDSHTGLIIAAMACTVFEADGTPVAVIAVDISMDTLNEMANLPSATPGITTYILHPSGRYISNPDISLIMERDFFIDQGLEAFRNEITAQRPFFGTDGRTIVASIPIGMGNWTLVSIIPTAAVFESLNRAIKMSVLITLGIFTVFMVFLFFIIRNRLNLINVVSKELKEISEGEGDLTRTISVKSNNEIGDLSRYYNLTLEKIRNLVSVINRQSTLLFDIGTELAGNMEQSAVAMNQITSNIQTIKSRAINQSASVTETGATMEQITLNISKLNGFVEHQSEMVLQSSASIEGMMTNIQMLVGTLVKNAGNVRDLMEASASGRNGWEKVAANIKEIARESEGILEINAVMENIASQTNLLSMNAAIEAAHAGNAGKGFAVVAGEIRKLAESSSDQSKIISNVLKKIKDAIDKIMKSTEEVLARFETIDNRIKVVADQEESVRNTMEKQGAGSKQVLDVIDQLNKISRQVENGSEEMLKGSKEVIQESKNLERATREITDGMNDMANGAEQINASIHRINELSAQNRNNIDALVREVAKFKIE
jgi:methyl-accepting chemotaxis protein